MACCKRTDICPSLDKQNARWPCPSIALCPECPSCQLGLTSIEPQVRRADDHWVGDGPAYEGTQSVDPPTILETLAFLSPAFDQARATSSGSGRCSIAWATTQLRGRSQVHNCTARRSSTSAAWAQGVGAQQSLYRHVPAVLECVLDDCHPGARLLQAQLAEGALHEVGLRLAGGHTCPCTHACARVCVEDGLPGGGPWGAGGGTGAGGGSGGGDHAPVRWQLHPALAYEYASGCGCAAGHAAPCGEQRVAHRLPWP